MPLDLPPTLTPPALVLSGKTQPSSGRGMASPYVIVCRHDNRPQNIVLGLQGGGGLMPFVAGAAAAVIRTKGLQTKAIMGTSAGAIAGSLAGEALIKRGAAAVGERLWDACEGVAAAHVAQYPHLHPMLRFFESVAQSNGNLIQAQEQMLRNAAKASLPWPYSLWQTAADQLSRNCRSMRLSAFGLLDACNRRVFDNYLASAWESAAPSLPFNSITECLKDMAAAGKAPDWDAINNGGGICEVHINATVVPPGSRSFVRADCYPLSAHNGHSLQGAVPLCDKTLAGSGSVFGLMPAVEYNDGRHLREGAHFYNPLNLDLVEHYAGRGMPIVLCRTYPPEHPRDIADRKQEPRWSGNGFNLIADWELADLKRYFPYVPVIVFTPPAVDVSGTTLLTNELDFRRTAMIQRFRAAFIQTHRLIRRGIIREALEAKRRTHLGWSPALTVKPTVIHATARRHSDLSRA